MDIEIKQYRRQSNGVLYKLTPKIQLIIENTKIMFNPENYRDLYYIKWKVNHSEGVEDISSLENCIREKFKDEKNFTFESNFQSRPNYPIMLQTRYIPNKGEPIIINNSTQSVVEYLTNNSEALYTITLELGNIFLNNTKKKINYSLNITSIKLVQNKGIFYN